MKRVYEADVYHVSIKWSKPHSIDNVDQFDYWDIEDVYFYKILARYGQTYHLLYIGKAFKQYVSQRLANPDHALKKFDLFEKYPHHELMISFGHLININCNRTARLIDEIESLLIYMHDDHPRLENKMSRWTHGIARDYHILNQGFRGEGMVKEIGLGLFYKE